MGSGGIVSMLEWRRVGKQWHAVDGSLRYRAVMGEGLRWRVRLGNELIGEAKGFATVEGAMDYVDWGGVPCRMGYDRETGEVHELAKGGSDVAAEGDGERPVEAAAGAGDELF